MSYRILFENLALPFGIVFIQIILPSLLLNLLIAVAIHPLMRDIATWFYPAEAKHNRIHPARHLESGGSSSFTGLLS